jgi:hypothetical protein
MGWSFVRNRSQPDGSIVQGYLTDECIEFCTDFINLEKPIGLALSRHVGRLGDVRNKRGRKDTHVFRTVPLMSDDHKRVHTMLLQHLSNDKTVCSKAHGQN